MKLSNSEYLIHVDDYHEFDNIIDTLKQFDMHFSYEKMPYDEDEEYCYRAIFTKIGKE